MNDLKYFNNVITVNRCYRIFEDNTPHLVVVDDCVFNIIGDLIYANILPLVITTKHLKDNNKHVFCVSDNWLDNLAEFLTKNNSKYEYKFWRPNTCFTSKYKGTENLSDSLKEIKLDDVFNSILPSVMTNNFITRHMHKIKIASSVYVMLKDMDLFLNGNVMFTMNQHDQCYYLQFDDKWCEDALIPFLNKYDEEPNWRFDGNTLQFKSSNNTLFAYDFINIIPFVYDMKIIISVRNNSELLAKNTSK